MSDDYGDESSNGFFCNANVGEEEPKLEKVNSNEGENEGLCFFLHI